MNKQEFQQTIKNMKYKKDCVYMSSFEVFLKGFEKAKELALLHSSSLDEPEKPVVPQFVADWLEVCKDNLALSLASSMNNIVARTNNQPDKTISWIAKNSETFAKAWIYGYEVEKEKLYTVEIPNPNSAGGKLVLSKQQSTGRLILEMLNSDINKPKYLHLTEDEIKKDFGWAWQFAAEVEE